MIPLHLLVFAIVALVCHGGLADDRPVDGAADRVLLLDLARRHARRPVQRAARAGHVHRDRRIPDRPRRRVPGASATRARRRRRRRWRRDLAGPARVGAAVAVASVLVNNRFGSSPRFLILGAAVPGAAGVHGAAAPACDSRRASRRCWSPARSCRARSAARCMRRARSSASTACAWTSSCTTGSCSTARRCTACRASLPERRGEPLSYYHRTGPDRPGVRRRAAGRGRARGRGRRARRRHARELRAPAQRWTFYEIDPAVERIARNPRYFTYLQDCGAMLHGRHRRCPRCRWRGRRPQQFGLHRARRLQLRRDPDPPADARSAGAVPVAPRAGRRDRAAHLEPAPVAQPGARPPRRRIRGSSALWQQEPPPPARSGTASFRRNGS